jgi:hypothetical protein
LPEAFLSKACCWIPNCFHCRIASNYFNWKFNWILKVHSISWIGRVSRLNIGEFARSNLERQISSFGEKLNPDRRIWIKMGSILIEFGLGPWVLHEH